MELKLTPRFLQNGQRFFGPGVAELLARARVDTLLLPDVSDDAGARFRVELAARNHGVDIQYCLLYTSPSPRD